MTLGTLIFALYIAMLPDMDGDVAIVWNTYQLGDFRGVSQQVSTLAYSPEISDYDRAILWLTLGCSEAMLGNLKLAAEAFIQSMEYQSDLGITSSDLPPPVWAVYQQVKHDFNIEIDKVKAKPNMDNEHPDIINEVAEKPPMERIQDMANIADYSAKPSAPKSIIFPGWGQWSDGRRSGKYIIVTELALITGYIAASIQTKKAKDEYLKARVPAIIEVKYDKYNNLSRLSKALAIASVGTYLLAQFDYFGIQKLNLMSLSYQPHYFLTISVTM